MQVTKISKRIFTFQGIPYLNTVTVTAVTPSGEQTVLWRVRSLTDNEWHYAHTPLPLGYYQLNFQFSGREFRGGFDDVTVRLGNCSEHSKYKPLGYIKKGVHSFRYFLPPVCTTVQLWPPRVYMHFYSFAVESWHPVTPLHVHGSLMPPRYKSSQMLLVTRWALGFCSE